MIDARQIMSVVVSLILLSIGIFVVGIIATTNTVLDLDYDGNFAVTDPTVDQLCDTEEWGLTGITVTQFDGITWTAVPAVNVTYAGSIVTVQSGALVGGS